MKDISVSTLPNECQKRIMDGLGFGWKEQLSMDTIRDFFQAAARYLGIKKNKDKPVVLELRDLNGGFHLAGIVQFLPQSEEGSDEGSWALNFTFDETDIDKSWEIINFADHPEAYQVFYDTTYANHGITWRFKALDANEQICDGNAVQILCVLIDCLADYMRLNVTIDPELGIDDMIAFKAELSGDKVYIGVTCGPMLKQFCKADASIGTVGAPTAA